MFMTHDDARYDMPKSVSGIDRQHWESVSFSINSYVFMITYVSCTDPERHRTTLMVASTELLIHYLTNRVDWHVVQVALLAPREGYHAGWTSHSISKLEVGKNLEVVESGLDTFTDIIRMTTDTKEILYIEDDLVTREPEHGNYRLVFQV